MYFDLIQWQQDELYIHNISKKDQQQSLQSIQKREWWPNEKLRDWQWQKLKELLNKAYNDCPYYTNLFHSMNATPEDIQSEDDYRKIPILTKAIIQENFSSLISEKLQRRLLKTHTRGGTRPAMEFRVDVNTMRWQWPIYQQFLAWANINVNHTIACLNRYQPNMNDEENDSDIIPGLSDKLMSWLQKRHFFNTSDNSFEERLKVLKSFRIIRPTALIGSPSDLYQLATTLRDEELSLKPIRVIISEGDKLLPNQRSMIEDCFQGKVFNTYGFKEVGLVASECERHQGFHLHMDSNYVEVLDHNDQPVANNDVGDLIVTHLHNYGMPFIRYRSGDLVKTASYSCPCERQLPLIAEVVGRKQDAIHRHDGQPVGGEVFPNIIKEFPMILQVQIDQSQRDHLDISVVASTPMSQDTIDRLQTMILQQVGDAMKIQTQQVDALPLTNDSQHRLRISRVE